jgi:hypothetical protein
MRAVARSPVGADIESIGCIMIVVPQNTSRSASIQAPHGATDLHPNDIPIRIAASSSTCLHAACPTPADTHCSPSGGERVVRTRSLYHARSLVAGGGDPGRHTTSFHRPNPSTLASSVCGSSCSIPILGEGGGGDTFAWRWCCWFIPFRVSCVSPTLVPHRSAHRVRRRRLVSLGRGLGSDAVA